MADSNVLTYGLRITVSRDDLPGIELTTNMPEIGRNVRSENPAIDAILNTYAEQVLGLPEGLTNAKYKSDANKFKRAYHPHIIRKIIELGKQGRPYRQIAKAVRVRTGLIGAVLGPSRPGPKTLEGLLRLRDGAIRQNQPRTEGGGKQVYTKKEKLECAV